MILSGCIDNSLDSVTVWIDDECSVVMFAIFQTEFWHPIVLPAVPESCFVKAHHRLARWRGKRDVEPGPEYNHIAGIQLDREPVIAARESVADRCCVCPDANVAEPRKRRVVERRGPCEVYDAEG